MSISCRKWWRDSSRRSRAPAAGIAGRKTNSLSSPAQFHRNLSYDVQVYPHFLSLSLSPSLICSLYYRGKTSLLFQYALNVASASPSNRVVFICRRKRIEANPPFLSQVPFRSLSFLFNFVFGILQISTRIFSGNRSLFRCIQSNPDEVRLN